MVARATVVLEEIVVVLAAIKKYSGDYWYRQCGERVEVGSCSGGSYDNSIDGRDDDDNNDGGDGGMTCPSSSGSSSLLSDDERPTDPCPLRRRATSDAKLLSSSLLSGGKRPSASSSLVSGTERPATYDKLKKRRGSGPSTTSSARRFLCRSNRTGSLCSQGKKCSKAPKTQRLVTPLTLHDLIRPRSYTLHAYLMIWLSSIVAPVDHD
ncbi:uncharacterized protein LOC120111965 [Phoenix dactylifera]|uniref:Uncharacterized protein LOC120111965 n=1 Tax=Phoenix dactylifera TaxID=42345 RepID=A0A8B9AIB9_PHODC|nr:uncharacterized protein LOC120111965 [Phoenix dactylifera]